MRTCGLFAAEGVVDVVKDGKGRASVRGVYTCGSRICPVCSARLAARSIGQVIAATERVVDAGGTALFVTLSVPHSRGGALSELLDALQAGWNASMSGRGGRVWKHLGRVGYVRALDYTHGQNGHHPHYHCIVLFDRSVNDYDLAWLTWDLRERWERAVRRSLGRDTVEAAVKVDRVKDDAGRAVGKYLLKAITSATLETVWSAGKGNSRGRSIWQVLAGAERSEADRRTWREIERATLKRRWFTASRGLLLEEEPEGEDGETIQEPEQLAPDDAPALSMSGPFWRAVNRGGYLALMFGAVEDDPRAPRGALATWQALTTISLGVPKSEGAWLEELDHRWRPVTV